MNTLFLLMVLTQDHRPGVNNYFTTMVSKARHSSFDCSINSNGRPPQKYSVVINGDGMSYTLESTNTYVSKGKSITEPYKYATVLDGGFLIGFYPATSKNSQLPARRVSDANSECIGNQFFLSHLYLSRNPCSLVDVIAATTNIIGPREDILDGVKTELYISESKYGKTSVWFDPNRSHLLMKIHQQKSLDSFIMNDKRIRDLSPQQNDSSSKSLLSLDLTWILSNHQLHDGFYFPRKIRISEIDTYRQSPPELNESTVEYSNLRFFRANMTEHRKLLSYIPEGARVDIEDETTIRHEWRDGKIVKKVSTKAVEQVAQVEFKKPESSALRWLWISIPVVGVLLVIAFVWRKRGRA
jgi:hypothetical protein